jgi:PTS system fructose-specific IIC component
MLGSAVTGAIIMGSGVTLRAPHGGIFVFFAMGKPLLFFLALAIGTVITALGVVALKQFTGKSDAEIEAAATTVAA